jgi:photosystem II stability/assembly factor-like uncharacterized protein
MPTSGSYIRLTVLLLLMLPLAEPATAAAAPDGLAHEPRPSTWKQDASLTDVYFVDRQRGWAVGSQGVLLRTEDGGRTWGEGSLTSTRRRVAESTLAEKFRGIRAKKQLGAATAGNSSAPFSCRFESVCFTDAKNGWAAGGYDVPYLNYSRAVIARTNDGGKSWQSLPQLMIPRIHKIEFRGMERLSGWAIGTSDPATNSGLFFTADAGNIWSSQKSKRMPDLIDAESTGNRFVGIDQSGKLATFDTAKFEYSVVATDEISILADVAMEQKTGWAVGSDGTVLTTNNSGLSWSPAPIDQALLSTFDFRCVHLSKDKVWFAGDPGHVLFSLDRKSNQLQAHPLPRGIAINKINFIDETFGWAVGDLGKIYATQDGGENWTMQRGRSAHGISQTGILAFCKDASELPLELIARHAGEDGKLLGVAMPQKENFDSVRLAAERVGAAVVTPFQKGDASEETLLRKTVRMIRLQKPTIVIGAESRFIERAVRMASDENAFPQQLASGLSVWQSKFMIVTDPNGSIEFDNDVYLARLGTLLEDVVMPSRMICGLPMYAGENSAFFAWRFVGDGADSRRTEVEKNPLLQSSIVKRKQTSIPLGSLSAVRKIGQKRQRMKALTQMPINSVLDVEQGKRAIAEFTFGLNTERTGSSLAGVWLMQLADRYVAAGRPQQAAWALEQLAVSLPEHCFAPLASATLAKYYSSAEQNYLAVDRWQQLRSNIGQASRIPKGLTGGQQQIAIQKGRLRDGSTEYRWDKVDLAAALEEAAAMPLDIDVEQELKDFDPDTVDLTLEAEEPEVDLSTQAFNLVPMNAIEVETFLKQRNRSAASHFSRLGQRDPSLLKRADFQYLHAHIVKQLSGDDDAEPYYRNVLKAKPHATFSPAASDETRASNQSLTTEVIATAERPHLDGLPNDPVWQEVLKARQTIKLPKSTNAIMDDIAMVAWDRQYLYVYARCYKSDRFSYAADPKALRGRDADLSNQDRIEINFDVDRDLLSSWRISIDYRGEVLESCSTAKSWNPKMFVAKHQDDRVWSIECAIPLKDLAASVKAEDTWRVDVRRLQNEMPWSDGVFWGVDIPASGSLMMFR